MKLSIAIVCAIAASAAAQPAAPASSRATVAHVSIWKPKPGKQSAFENGYKQHLQWHKRNRDPWSWYGWFVSSGPRDGLFIDATFDHPWSDFDSSVKPAEDSADNERNVEPHADFLFGYKMVLRPELSAGAVSSVTSKFVRSITLTFTDKGDADRVLAQVRGKLGLTSFLVYQIVDGGNLDQFQILIGAASWAEYERSAGLIEQIHAVERSLKVKPFTEFTAETLRYRADLTLIAGGR